jgi:hypothetical protein
LGTRHYCNNKNFPHLAGFAGHFLFRALACLLKGLACDRAYFWFSEKIVGRRSLFVLAIRDRTIIIAAIPLR